MQKLRIGNTGNFANFEFAHLALVKGTTGGTKLMELNYNALSFDPRVTFSHILLTNDQPWRVYCFMVLRNAHLDCYHGRGLYF